MDKNVSEEKAGGEANACIDEAAHASRHAKDLKSYGRGRSQREIATNLCLKLQGKKGRNRRGDLRYHQRKGASNK